MEAKKIMEKKVVDLLTFRKVRGKNPVPAENEAYAEEEYDPVKAAREAPPDEVIGQVVIFLEDLAPWVERLSDLFSGETFFTGLCDEVIDGYAQFYAAANKFDEKYSDRPVKSEGEKRMAKPDESFSIGDTVIWDRRNEASPTLRFLIDTFGDREFTVIGIQNIPADMCACGRTGEHSRSLAGQCAQTKREALNHHQSVAIARDGVAVTDAFVFKAYFNEGANDLRSNALKELAEKTQFFWSGAWFRKVR
jgi:hypothetical protein